MLYFQVKILCRESRWDPNVWKLLENVCTLVINYKGTTIVALDCNIKNLVSAQISEFKSDHDIPSNCVHVYILFTFFFEFLSGILGQPQYYGEFNGLRLI